jgi:hypothetical protein
VLALVRVVDGGRVVGVEPSTTVGGLLVDVLGPAARAELLHVLMLPDFDRADRIGEFWGHPETRAFGELLIDLEEVKAARAVVFGLLAEMERKG